MCPYVLSVQKVVPNVLKNGFIMALFFRVCNAAWTALNGGCIPWTPWVLDISVLFIKTIDP